VDAKWKLIAGAVVIAVVFLIGFVPQFLEKRRLEVELEAANARLATAQLQIVIDDLRELSGRMLLEASRQNYGTAREHSTAYFDKLRELADKSSESALKASLLDLLNSRDSITSGLAQVSKSINSDLQSLLERTYNLPDASLAR